MELKYQPMTRDPIEIPFLETILRAWKILFQQCILMILSFNGFLKHYINISQFIDDHLYLKNLKSNNLIAIHFFLFVSVGHL